MKREAEEKEKQIRYPLREDRPRGHPERVHVALFAIRGAVEHFRRHKHRRADGLRHLHRLSRGTARPKV